MRASTGSAQSPRMLNLQTVYDLQVEADRLGPKPVRDVEILRRAV
jgi:hypothetical protein